MQGRATTNTSMAEIQQATPPPWLGRSRWRLLADVVGGWRQLRDRVVQIGGVLAGLFCPPLGRSRLQRLRALGHIDVVPSIAQLLVAARDQMMIGATEETKIFYQTQRIPWVF